MPVAVSATAVVPVAVLAVLIVSMTVKLAPTVGVPVVVVAVIGVRHLAILPDRGSGASSCTFLARSPRRGSSIGGRY